MKSLADVIAPELNKISGFEGLEKPEDVAEIAWAYAGLGVLQLALMEAISHQLRRSPHEFSLNGLVTLADAYSRFQIKDKPLMQAIARQLLNKDRLGELSENDIVAVARAYTSVCLYELA